MEKIFSYNVDIDKTAYMNWRTRPHQPIHDMMIIADGYMKAAIMLAQDCLQDNMDKKADIVVFPILDTPQINNFIVLLHFLHFVSKMISKDYFLFFLFFIKDRNCFLKYFLFSADLFL